MSFYLPMVYGRCVGTATVLTLGKQEVQCYYCIIVQSIDPGKKTWSQVGLIMWCLIYPLNDC